MPSLLKTANIFLSSKSSITPQDKLDVQVSVDAPDDSLFHFSLNQFDMPVSSINLDSLGLAAIYVRFNLGSTNMSNSLLEGASEVPELQNTQILGKIAFEPGLDRIVWEAQHENGNMAVVAGSNIDNLVLRVTDEFNNDLSTLTSEFDANGAGFFGCTLRMSSYDYFNNMTAPRSYAL